MVGSICVECIAGNAIS